MKKLKQKFLENTVFYLISLASLILFFAVWWIYAIQPSSFISTPLEVLERIIYMCYTPVAKTLLWGHIAASLWRVLVAFVLASVIGVGLGIGFGWFKPFRRFIWPLFSIVRPIPPIAWIPLIILWCGIGELSKIIVVFIRIDAGRHQHLCGHFFSGPAFAECGQNTWRKCPPDAVERGTARCYSNDYCWHENGTFHRLAGSGSR